MTDRFTPSALVIVLLLIGGVWLAQAHARVVDQAAGITNRYVAYDDNRWVKL